MNIGEASLEIGVDQKSLDESLATAEAKVRQSAARMQEMLDTVAKRQADRLRALAAALDEPQAREAALRDLVRSELAIYHAEAITPSWEKLCRDIERAMRR